jgi:hypothetical protein
MSNYVLPLLSVAVGALLALFSTLVVSFMRQRQDITLRLVDQFFQVRKEIVDVVTDLANLGVRQSFEASRRAEYRDSVSKLFYKHYDFLPPEVLQSLTLLDVCLSNSGGKLYTLKGKRIVPMNDNEVISFIAAISTYDNTRCFAPLALSDNDSQVRTNQAIALHARNVLFTLNKSMSLKNLSAITKRLKKESAK